MDQPNIPHMQLATLRQMDRNALDAEIAQPSAFVLARAHHRNRCIETVWAPFDHVNRNARIVIVGITPGRQQMTNALRRCHEALAAGASDAEALEAAKVFASFSGPMRKNLVDLLDDIGVARLLGLETTAALWSGASGLVHFTSALRYPVFVDGRNYSGQPRMLSVPELRDQLETWMGTEMAILSDAVFVPLGPKVGEALAWLAGRVGISPEQVLTGLPHPSGASAERIAYWLGRKPREALSNKTNPDKLDAARAALVDKISRLED